MPSLLRYTLDLFGDAQQAPVQTPPDKPSKPPIPLAGTDFVAINSVANNEPESPFSHPQANARVQLLHQMVAYVLQRSARRSIGLRVLPQGLEVRAPRWVSVAQIEAVLQGKAAWVLRQLRAAHERERHAPTPLRWADGAELPYLGQPLRLRLDASQARSAVLLDCGEGRDMATLVLPLSGTLAQPEQVRDAAQAWLMAQARALFTERLDHFAATLGVRWTRLQLSSARTRWGSARTDGSIRLHWRLIHLRQALIDYVVVHELSHLREMNHSPQFWDTVEGVLPQWGALRTELRRTELPPL